MFFGLTNSPATFQAMMNEVFKDLIDMGKVFIYMDDILITTATIEEHCHLVNLVLQCLKDNDLFLKPEKCDFEQSKIKYLGLHLCPSHVAMDPIKLVGITEWPAPHCLQEVCSFLGFASFYHCFICSFSHLACPLNDLTKKGTPWSWSPLVELAFQSLKTHFAAFPILIQPNISHLFHLECDASKMACGAVLSQWGDDNLWHPIAFMSKSFIEAKCNYDIYNCELLAIIRALEEWHHYLKGSPHMIEILSDHKNLEIFKEAHKLSCHQACWVLFLTCFNFTIT